jgi:hypothetical protein
VGRFGNFSSGEPLDLMIIDSKSAPEASRHQHANRLGLKSRNATLSTSNTQAERLARRVSGFKEKD